MQEEKIVYDSEDKRILITEEEFNSFLEANKEGLIKQLVESNWINEEFFIPRHFEEAKMPTQGKCCRIELQRIKDNIQFFLEKRKNEEEEEIRKRILQSVFKALESPQKFKLIYLLIPKKKWVYRDRDTLTWGELQSFASIVGGYTAGETEANLYLATVIVDAFGSKEIWEYLLSKSEYRQEEPILLSQGGYPCLLGKRNWTPATICDCSRHDTYENELPGIVLKSLDCV